MIRALAPVAAFVVTAGYCMARLQARQRFAYAFADGVPAVLLIVFVIFDQQSTTGDALVWGTLAGYALQTLWLGELTRRADPIAETVSLRRQAGEWRLIYGPLFVMAAGQAVLSFTNPLDQWLASDLGEGQIATLGYANRIISLVFAFGSIVVARALLPVLSEAAAQDEWRLGSRQARQWAYLLTALGLAGASVGWLIAPWAVSMLFERGAFTAEDSHGVADALRFGLFQLPFCFGGMALVQWLAVIGRYDVLLWVACVALAVKAAMNFLLINSFGLAGLMVASASMYAVSFLFQLAFVSKKDDKFAPTSEGNRNA
jgi:peptidoglycan biosynthesis protein MviN/MurJ (putative lipid II flippase)